MISNIPVVDVSQFTKIVEMHINEGNKRPIFGLGKGGIGKTESIYDLAKKLNIGYVDVRLLLYTETDLKGIPYPDKEGKKTIWLQNNILPNEERDGKYGILVLDEITSAPRSVRTSAYQLLNERRLGEYILPDGWIIVCLGNGEEDGGDYQGMEGNFSNRCSIFNVVHSVESWKEWAYSKDINYLVLGYVSWRPGDLHTFNPNDEANIVFASPRSWKAVSDILNKNEFDKDDYIGNARIMANIGTLVGNQFLSFCKYKKSAIEPSDIISGAVKSVTIDSNEVLFMTMQGVIKLLSDKIKVDIHNNNTVTENTLNNCANGLNWLFGLRSMEHKVMGLKDFVATDRQNIISHVLLNPQFNKICPQLQEFATENSVVFKRG